MLNLPEKLLRLQQGQRQPPRQHRGRRYEREPSRNDVRPCGIPGRPPHPRCCPDGRRFEVHRPTRNWRSQHHIVRHPSASDAQDSTSRDPTDPDIHGCGCWSRRSTAIRTAPGNASATRLFFRPARSLPCKVHGQGFPQTRRATNVCAKESRIKSGAAGILDAEAMNTFAECHAGPSTASNADARWRCD